MNLNHKEIMRLLGEVERRVLLAVKDVAYTDADKKDVEVQLYYLLAKLKLKTNADPRDILESTENTLNPFHITKNSLKKCMCGHTIGFHHINGWCKGSVTDGCDCKEVRVTK